MKRVLLVNGVKKKKLRPLSQAFGHWKMLYSFSGFELKNLINPTNCTNKRIKPNQHHNTPRLLRQT